MNYKLYQIDLENDTERYAFMGQEFLDELGLRFPPPRELYSLTYEGSCTDINPEELFYLLNVDHPADYRTRSLSVSDVIVYTWDGNELPCGGRQKPHLASRRDRFGFDPHRQPPGWRETIPEPEQ